MNIPELETRNLERGTRNLEPGTFFPYLCEKQL